MEGDRHFERGDLRRRRGADRLGFVAEVGFLDSEVFHWTTVVTYSLDYDDDGVSCHAEAPFVATFEE